MATTQSITPTIPGTARIPAPGQRDPKLWKTASDFEKLFLENMLGHMTSGLKGEGPLAGEGTGGQIWRDMLTKEYAGSVTKAGGIGIASNIYNELLRLQGGAHASR
jgi:flagellar protein FlgJ